MRIVECEQGTEAWREARSGLLTASRFNRIITAKQGKLSTQVRGLVYELLAEKWLGWDANELAGYVSPYMARGTDLEEEARNWFQFETNQKVTQVGLCISDCGRWGCSPDGLTETGGVELKCPKAKTHVSYLIEGELPDEYKAQVHGSMIVTGRTHWHFMSYHPMFEPFLLRVERDEFTDKLEEALVEASKVYVEMEQKLQEFSPIRQPKNISYDEETEIAKIF